jgi:hypothetical protein
MKSVLATIILSLIALGIATPIPTGDIFTRQKFPNPTDPIDPPQEPPAGGGLLVTGMESVNRFFGDLAPFLNKYLKNAEPAKKLGAEGLVEELEGYIL